MQAQVLDGFIGDGRRVELAPVFGQSVHEVGGGDCLEEAEGVEGVLLLEAVRLAVGLSEPFADLDDLRDQQRGRAGDGQVERAGIEGFQCGDGDLLVVDQGRFVGVITVGRLLERMLP